MSWLFSRALAEELMLIDETNEELCDRIEYVIYVLGERMDSKSLRDLVEPVVARAMLDVDAENQDA